MKAIACLLAVFLIIASCGPSASPAEAEEPQGEETATETVDSNSVNTDVEIDATPARVWEIITSPEYKKVLGAEFDKNAFMESDYKLGSKVYFKYEPNRVVTTGTIAKLTEEEYIQIDYDFSGFAYTEQISLKKHDGKTTIKIYAGPYTSDLEAQKVVWKNWLLKVKEICELESM